MGEVKKALEKQERQAMSAPVPAENTVRKCKYCVLIFDARTVKMANMPLEAKPIRGLYTVPPLGPGETQHRCERLEFTVFQPHWGNCPGAEEARRRG